MNKKNDNIMELGTAILAFSRQKQDLCAQGKEKNECFSTQRTNPSSCLILSTPQSSQQKSTHGSGSQHTNHNLCRFLFIAEA